MVNNSPQTRVYCTRPSCQHPINIIEEPLASSSFVQRFCHCCGMPLILSGRFLPLDLLVPDEERGGFGRTFLGQDLSFPHRPLRVIKQLHPRIPPGRSKLTPAEIQTIEDLFKREARVLEQFNHPQIPRAWAFFVIAGTPDLREEYTQETDYQRTFFYLVQDYIEGQNLAQELQQNGQFSGRDVIDVLQQILPVLNYIHNLRTPSFYGVLHRDIKPSNIMRSHQENRDGKNLHLIDFGAVKQVVVAGVPIEQSCILGTREYSPLEQINGEPISSSSDLYSLAVTCICLLTAKNPKELRNYRGSWNWRQYATVNDNLARILDKMLSPNPGERFQSAQEVIYALSGLSTQQSPSPLPQGKQKFSEQRRDFPTTIPPEKFTPVDSLQDKKNKPTKPSIFQKLKKFCKRSYLLGLLFLAFLGLAVAVVIHLITTPLCSKYSCDTSDAFSWGEQVLLSDNDIKQKGTRAFFKGDYDEAIQLFQEYLKSNRNDPEALIYLNNAYAARTNNPIKIAVSIPIQENESGVDKEMLRGVAHAQSEFNCGVDNIASALKNNNTSSQLQCNNSGQLLQIQIANDEQDETNAKKVVNGFTSNHNILGVIGHFSSKVTSAVANIYQNAGLVVISPTSTVPRVGYGLTFNKHVFRTSPTDTVAAGDLVDYMITKNYLKAAIVIDDDPYTKSLSGEFTKIFQKNGGTVIGTPCNLSQESYRLENCVRKAQENDTTTKVLFLALSDETSNKAATSIYSNSSSFNILGGDGVYNASALKADISRIADEKLVLAVPWHRTKNSEQNSDTVTSSRQFEDSCSRLWGTRNVSWRTAMTYDATKVMAEALKSLGDAPTRRGLYHALSTGFSVQGAAGKVEFDSNHDRKISIGIGVLVKVENSNPQSNSTNPDFVILKRPERSNK